MVDIESSSSRRRFWIDGFWARRNIVQVIVTEEESEPANINVLILCRRSSSDMRASGARSAERFALTGRITYHALEETCVDCPLTQKCQDIFPAICLSAFLPVNNETLSIANKISSYMVYCLSTACYNFCGSIRLINAYNVKRGERCLRHAQTEC